MQPLPLNSQRGSALLEALVAIGIVSISLATITQAMATQLRSVKALSARFESYEIHKSLLHTVDCEETIFHVCVGSERRLFSKAGPLILEIPYRGGHVVTAGSRKDPLRVFSDQDDPLRTIDVACRNGIVEVGIYNKTTQKTDQLYPDGICRRQYQGPEKCKPGYRIASIDRNAGDIRCMKDPEK